MSENDLDKYYTNPEVVKLCLQKLDLNQFDTIIESSAGDGAFSNQIQRCCFAYDIEPEYPSIIRQDFLSLDASQFKGRILTGWNPPYGRNCAKAIKFFNKAASYSDTIAFILPKSFKKDSIQDKLNRYFHLVESFDLPKNSFHVNGEEYDVPSCFQIWERRCYQRPLSKKENPIGFRFVKKYEADIVVKRVGGKAGEATTDIKGSESTNTFISLENKSQVREFLDKLNNHTWPHNNTVGRKSISQKEFAELLNEIAFWGYNVHRWFQETMIARIGLFYPSQNTSNGQKICISWAFLLPPALLLSEP